RFNGFQDRRFRPLSQPTRRGAIIHSFAPSTSHRPWFSLNYPAKASASECCDARPFTRGSLAGRASGRGLRSILTGKEVSSGRVRLIEHNTFATSVCVTGLGFALGSLAGRV